MTKNQVKSRLIDARLKNQPILQWWGHAVLASNIWHRIYSGSDEIVGFMAPRPPGQGHNGSRMISLKEAFSLVDEYYDQH